MCMYSRYVYRSMDFSTQIHDALLQNRMNTGLRPLEDSEQRASRGTRRSWLVTCSTAVFASLRADSKSSPTLESDWRNVRRLYKMPSSNNRILRLCHIHFRLPTTRLESLTSFIVTLLLSQQIRVASNHLVGGGAESQSASKVPTQIQTRTMRILAKVQAVAAMKREKRRRKWETDRPSLLRRESVDDTRTT